MNVRTVKIQNDQDRWNVLLAVFGANSNTVRAQVKRALGAITNFHSLGDGAEFTLCREI